MLPSRLLRAKHATAYQPMIKFLGQRSKLEHEPHAPAPHPAAPQDVVDNFQSFLAKKQSTSAGPESPSSTPKGQSTSQSAQGQTPADNGSGDRKKSGNSSSGSSGSGLLEKSSKPADFENFWEAPSYLWTPKEMSEREIEAIMSGGATDIRSGP